MSVEMEYTETLTVTHCWCGIALAIPDNLMRYARNHKGHAVHCPLGHSFVFGDSYEEQLSRERQRHQATRELLQAEERSHRSTRGALTKQRRRVQAGICPCCGRTFQQLARHMQSKHPDFNPEAMPDADTNH